MTSRADRWRRLDRRARDCKSYPSLWRLHNQLLKTRVPYRRVERAAFEDAFRMTQIRLTGFAVVTQIYLTAVLRALLAAKLREATRTETLEIWWHHAERRLEVLPCFRGEYDNLVYELKRSLQELEAWYAERGPDWMLWDHAVFGLDDLGSTRKGTEAQDDE